MFLTADGQDGNRLQLKKLRFFPRVFSPFKISLSFLFWIKENCTRV